jgi:3-oxoadipate enol-lactonase
MPICEVFGGPLAYDDEGTGAAVVLLHAGIADRRMWAPVATVLAGRYRVVRPDLRGYGESSPPVSSFAHYDDVVGLLDRLGIGRAALVGCSFGGTVALDAALAHPDRVGALALVGSVPSGYRWTDLGDTWDRVVGDVDEEDRAALAAAEVRLWVVGPDREPGAVDAGLIAFAEELDRGALAAEAALEQVDVRELSPPAVDRLGEVAAPTLVLAGAADLAEIHRVAGTLAAGIPDARRAPDVADAAHLLPLERPGPVAAALSAFLADVGWV